MHFKDKYNNDFECDFNFENVNTLVLSGGALKSVHFLGALHRLRNLNFTYYAGNSAGSVIITLLSVGYSSVDIFKEIYKDKNTNCMKSLEIVVEYMKKMFLAKNIDPNITFSKLYKMTNKKIAFVATNVSKLKEEVFSVDTHPHTSVITAVKLSCSLPLIFPLAVYKNQIFLDGIFCDNFPLGLTKKFNSTKVLAITTKSSHYERSICNFYKDPKLYKICMIPDAFKKYFGASLKDKFDMFMTGYFFIDDNIQKAKKHNRRNSF